jgi:hypothetical protein
MNLWQIMRYSAWAMLGITAFLFVIYLVERVG